MAEADATEDTSGNSEFIAKKIYVTQAIGEDEPPAVDGLLNDPVWEMVDWAADTNSRKRIIWVREVIKDNLKRG